MTRADAGMPARGFQRHASTVLAVLVVLGITAALSLGARSVHNSTENRLLHQRVREAGSELGSEFAAVETPLRAAAEVAEATEASGATSKQVQEFLNPLVGPTQQLLPPPFSSAEIFAYPTLQPAVGSRVNVLETKAPSAIQGLLRRAARTQRLTVVGLFGASPPRLAYAITSASPPVDYIIYAESALPKNRDAVAQSGAAFPGLAYALYLGSEQPKDLLAANTAALPLKGRRAATTISFGDNELSLVMSPNGQLGGRLLEWLPLLLVLAGLIVAAAAAALIERLVRQRERARELADENATLYSEQRTVAHTLQHSLLPATLPSIPGIELRARYVAGVADIDVGGDWYDIVPLSDGNVLFVVGDVSGRGLPAATVMASLRYAIRAYAAQGDDPATILTKLSMLISVADGGHFATVLCGVIDLGDHSVTLANAGHPQPLLIEGGEARFVATHIGVPIGVDDHSAYASVRLTVPASATLLAYTDGLIERRGELLDIGLERLRAAASGPRGSVDDLLAELAHELPLDGPADDVAILGVEWQD